MGQKLAKNVDSGAKVYIHNGYPLERYHIFRGLTYRYPTYITYRYPTYIPPTSPQLKITLIYSPPEIYVRPTQGANLPHRNASKSATPDTTPRTNEYSNYFVRNVPI